MPCGHPLYILTRRCDRCVYAVTQECNVRSVSNPLDNPLAASSTVTGRAHHAHGLHGLPRTAGALRVNRGMSLHQHMLPHTPLLCTAPFAPSILGVISTPDR